MSKNLLKSVICFAIAAVFALSGASFADDSFEFHGYMRAGLSTNENLNLPDGSMGVGSGTKYRLGNETNNAFIETVFVKNWKDDEGQWAKYNLRLDWHLDETHPYGNDTSSAGGDIANARVRETYVQMGGMSFLPKASVWAGLRYYSREDVHITDFYYRDMTAWGVGVESVKLGFADLNVAWLTAANAGVQLVDSDENTGKLQVHGLDVQFNEIKLPGGSFNLELQYKYLPGGDLDAAGTTSIDALSGYFVEGSYNLASFLGFAKGFTKIVGQYGTSIAAGVPEWGMNTFGSFAHAVWKATDEAGAKEIDEYVSYRGMLWGLCELSDDLSIMPLVSYQVFDKGDSDNKTITWLSAGARVKYSINRSFAMQFEAGYDSYVTETDSAGKTKPALMKFTIAPTFTYDTGFWTRPEIRLYATYASWDEKEGDVGAQSNSDDSSAMQFGAQAEAWW